MRSRRRRALLVWIGGIGTFVALIGGLAWYLRTAPHPLDAFASCLQEQGVQFYGAFWCPRCAEQKALFGRASRLLPYIECSPPSRQGQYPVCEAQRIRAYPTWVFPDGSRVEGVLPLEELARRSGCALPE